MNGLIFLLHKPLLLLIY